MENSARINAVCTQCGKGICVTNDGSHPTRRVPGKATALVFCSHTCANEWETAHCAWCGQTPRTTALAVYKRQGCGTQRKFCGVTHMQAYLQQVATTQD